MIGNIIDSRKRPYRWKRIDAVVEALEHDNCVKDADQAEPGDPDHYLTYDERRGVSIAEAVKWASDIPYTVTLYLYDPDTALGSDED